MSEGLLLWMSRMLEQAPGAVNLAGRLKKRSEEVREKAPRGSWTIPERFLKGARTFPKEQSWKNNRNHQKSNIKKHSHPSDTDGGRLLLNIPKCVVWVRKVHWAICRLIPSVWLLFYEQSYRLALDARNKSFPIYRRNVWPTSAYILAFIRHTKGSTNMFRGEFC